jgi:hypothetical protein
MAVTVTFDLANRDDRAEVQMLIEMMEPEKGCAPGCEHAVGTVSGGMETLAELRALQGIKPVFAGLNAAPPAFASTLPDTDGSEECEIDLASIGFGQSGNVPAPAAMAPAVTPSIAALTTAPTQTTETSPAPTVTVPAPPIAPTSSTAHAPVNGTPTPVAATPDKDAAGLPWDARIHSSSKALNADGTWRVRRGLNPVIKNQVEAELRAPKVPAMPGNVPPAPPAPVAAGSDTAVAVVPPAPPVTAPPVPVPPPVASSFAGVLMAMSAAKWDKARMDARIAAHGHTVASLVQADPAVWSALIAEANAS